MHYVIRHGDTKIVSLDAALQSLLEQTAVEIVLGHCSAYVSSVSRVYHEHTASIAKMTRIAYQF